MLMSGLVGHVAMQSLFNNGIIGTNPEKFFLPGKSTTLPYSHGSGVSKKFVSIYVYVVVEYGELDIDALGANMGHVDYYYTVYRQTLGYNILCSF